MTLESNPSSTKVCPTCGTRLSENATRCPVCGRTFTPASNPKKPVTSAVQTTRLPEVKLSLPLAIGLGVIILALGALIVFFGLQSSGKVASSTATPTVTITPTFTITPLPSPTATLGPTATPEPPLEHIVKIGEVCSNIAAMYHVSIQSIIDLNNLPPECGTLFENQKLLIPRPTPTSSPAPTGTLAPADATSQACGVYDYQVKENDTLSSISMNYNISIDSIKNFNNLTNDNVMVGMYLSLPLCERRATEGPTPTPTAPPPYPAVNLLLPADGAVFTNANETITLQWASAGTLRENEAYAVFVQDVTAGGDQQITQYVTDTKLIVPTTLRPADSTSHIFRWSVVVVRQTGTTRDGQPIYVTNGIMSQSRVFGWSGSVSATTSP